ncbi:MAG: hypothetical protein OEY85_04885 [Rhodospirillales bacterium]|nr:hypothetical protein [Rhodospirillales bacterium]
MKKYFVLLSLALFAVAALPVGADAGQIIVITSNDPGFKQGAVHDGRKSISLKAGTEITFVSASGKTISLKGPYSGVPDAGTSAGDPNLLKALGDIVQPPSKNTASAGVMRAGLHKPDDPWVIDAGRTGKHCISAGDSPKLWRGKANIKTNATVKVKGGTGEASIEWKKGEYLTPWPATLPLQDGTSYLVKDTATKRLRSLTVFVAPADLPTAAHKAVWMSKKGCRKQAETLLSQLR